MDKDINQFYLKEYETLAQAHFQAAQRITTFFQYALIILAAPLTVFSLFSNTTQISPDQSLLGILCIAISAVGLSITLYLGQLRTEVLMYARSINTIRNHFYDMNYQNIEHIGISKLNDSIVLPTQKMKPSYWDGEQFIFIVISLGIINTIYMGYALHLLMGGVSWVVYVIMAVFFSLHFLLYKIFTRCSEANFRFYKHRIGIDIDGVLNLHEIQFVSIYNKLIAQGYINSSPLHLEDIKTIPVQDGGLIKEADAKKVFNQSEYWTTIMPMPGASRVVTETLKNKLGYEIDIFTSRDWKPMKGDKSPYDIEKGTKAWLTANSFHWDYIKFEKGNFNSPISANIALYSNRFYLSSKRKIEFFIEDEPEKARKLSRICRYVFLIDHPYNQEEKENPFPYNVIRVTNWDDLEKVIRKLI